VFHISLKINTIDDIVRCATLSSLLELSGWPKPGNVHRTHDFISTRFEHFLAGIVAIQPSFRTLCERTYQLIETEDQCYEKVGLGQFFESAARDMMEWQGGGNVLLGHILILAPIIAAATICLKLNKLDLKDFKTILEKVIKAASVQDAVDLYRAIRICNPGGLGQAIKYDVWKENGLYEIISDKVSLWMIFNISKEHDLISKEYAEGYKLILEEALPFFHESYKFNRDINVAVVNTFLKILANHPDSLITRKSGIEIAMMVSQSAKKILDLGGINDKKGLKECMKLDEKLSPHDGKVNPGTTADLLAGVICCALLLGLRY
jgi:triphosphoribosyl-dephospho-CoA synthase